MQLVRVRLVRLGPFDDLVIPFADDRSQPRRMTVVHGGGGVGKTTVLSAIASTRPGHCAVVGPLLDRSSPNRGFAVADWRLDDEEPARPHALRVASPNASLDEPEEITRLRRKECALFDKQAEDEGFMFLAIPGVRWFSRQHVALNAPLRTVLRHDAKATVSFDDATRADLTREVKQALCNAAITGALASCADSRLAADQARDLEAAMHGTVDAMTRLAGYRYVGLDPTTFEPTFESRDGALVPFDLLPTAARHLASFGALPVRALFAAFRDKDPRQSQGVVAIDDAAMHLDAAAQHALPSTLCSALPRVQWILTTSSADLAAGCESSADLVALRRMPSSRRVEVFLGDEATLH